MKNGWINPNMDDSEIVMINYLWIKTIVIVFLHDTTGDDTHSVILLLHLSLKLSITSSKSIAEL